MTLRYYSNSAATTLAAATTYVATTIQVTSTTGFPILYPYTAILGRGTTSEEVVLVTAGSGTTLTVTRGFDGTSNFEHELGTTFEQGISAIDPREANLHVNSVANVHGVSTPVGTTETQTLTGKTLGVVGNIINGLGSNVVPITDNAGRLVADGGKAAPAGAFVGTSDAQTLTNKTLTNPIVNGGTFSGVAMPNVNLTGTPTVPTAAPGTSTTQAASTAFVTGALANKIPGGSVSSTGYFQVGNLLIQWGRGTLSFSNDSFVSAGISYPLSFSNSPAVTVTAYGSARVYATAPGTPTASSFTLGLQEHQDALITASIGYGWIAIGPA